MRQMHNREQSTSFAKASLRHHSPRKTNVRLHLRRETDGFQKKFRIARRSASFHFGKQIMPAARHITKEAILFIWISTRKFQRQQSKTNQAALMLFIFSDLNEIIESLDVCHAV
jgi:hypothetical protein